MQSSSREGSGAGLNLDEQGGPYFLAVLSFSFLGLRFSLLDRI